MAPASLPAIGAGEVMEFLERRRAVVQAVCLTGGEPTLTEGLEGFLAGLKDKGFKIKLDTNGTRPEVLAKLLDRGLLDYVALDIKAPPEKYEILAGTGACVAAVEESARILKYYPVAYELRTTVVPSLLDLEDLRAIGRWMAEAACFVLQPFIPRKSLLSPSLAQLPPCPEGLLTQAAFELSAYFARVEVRI